ncbi:MAG: TIGR03084 family metal-binding protein [Acidimicrobiales bacterium]
MTQSMDPICNDLQDETASLVELLVGLSEDEWDRPTPAERWLVRDQVSHLAYFDETATLAAVDPDRFKASVSELTDRMAVDPNAVDVSIEQGRQLSGSALLEWFTGARANMIDAFRQMEAKDRLPWYGPSMGARSFATARLMETWAHGQDIVDALGLDRAPSDRLYHIAHIGNGARPYSYLVNGLDAPTEPILVELKAPSGTIWTWGPDDAANTVRGAALDFSLLVTQRRHRNDVDLDVVGDEANRWLSFAQAFAGPAGSGREPLTR